MSLERHETQAVARLIYASAPEMFTLLLGQSSLQSLQRFVTHSHNRFSHRYVRVAESAHQVIGIATIVPALELNNNADSRSVLNFGARWRWQLAHRLILDRVLLHTYPANTFYIANLAVDAAYRGNGIGTQLLLHCIAEAKAADADQVFISVDINNPRAEQLYRSLGFEVVETRTMSLFGSTIGSRVLVRSLNPDETIGDEK